MEGPGPADGREPIPDGAEDILAQGLADRFGRPVRIVEARSRPLDTLSTHPISRLSLTLDGGERLTVVFKRLQPRPDRDIGRWMLTYRRLLADTRLDAPAVYASAYDPVRERYWLFLEDVGDVRLDWCDVDAWAAAVRWLARMNAAYYGRERELGALGCLVEHGPAFHGALARTARDVLRGWGEERLARFERLTAQWLDSSIDHLARCPRTLVHGDLYGSNIMVQPGPRIRPIDWDSAAIGAVGWDAAHLLAGWGPERPRFVATYLDEFARHAAAPPERRAFERTLTHCEIMRVLQTYCWEAHCATPKLVDRLLAEMEAACRSLEDGAARS